MLTAGHVPETVQPRSEWLTLAGLTPGARRVIVGYILVLETLVAFAHEQGLIPRPFTLEELFVPETITVSGA